MRAGKTCLGLTLAALFCVAGYLSPISAAAASERISQNASQSQDQTPSLFAENTGQVSDSAVRFVRSGKNAGVLLQDDGIVFRLLGSAFRVTFPGGRIVQPTGVGDPAARFNYYVGSDSARWRRGVPAFENVIYRDLYPGIDLVVEAGRSKLKYEFHADNPLDVPDRIRVAYSGIEGLSLSSDGRLHVRTRAGMLIEDAPYIYQVKDGLRVQVAGGFRLLDDSTYTIILTGPFDPNLPLVVDPSLAWSTFLGGSDAEEDNVVVARDSSGAVFVAGQTESAGFPMPDPNVWDITYNWNGNPPDASSDAFVAKFNAAGSLVWATYLGGTGSLAEPGSGDDYAEGIATDGAGGVYVAGVTWCSDFPTRNAEYPTFNGSTDAFVARFDSDGGLAWSTFLGSAGFDTATGVAMDSNGVYVTGYTDDGGFPVPNGWDQIFDGSYDTFVAKFTSAGSLVWSTFLGGSGNEYMGGGIATDGAGGVYVTSTTDSSDFPTTEGAYDRSYNGTGDAFVAKYTSAGALLWASYLGGAEDDYGNSIAADANGVYVTGETYSSDFPSVGGYDTSFNGGGEAFVTKFSSAGAYAWSTYLGGAGNELGAGIGVDGYGGVYVTGNTNSAAFPTLDAYDASFNGSGSLNAGDAFATKFNAAGSLIWSTYLGGSDDDYGCNVATDPSGGVYVAGGTLSSGFPVPNGWDTSYNGATDVFLAKFTQTLYSLNVQSTPVTGVAISGTAAGTTNYSSLRDLGASVSLTAPSTGTFGGTDVTFGRWKKNGVNQTEGQTALSFTISAATTCVAEYSVVQRMLNVQSTPITGVAITGTPAGATNYSSSRDDNSQVTLTAPATAANGSTDYSFVRWTINGAQQGGAAITFNINEPSTCVAEYTIVQRMLNVQSTPITGVAITGTPSGSTNYSSSRNDNSQVTLTAPTTAANGGSDYSFVRWTINGVPQGGASVTFNINADSTCVAEYTPALRTLTVQSTPVVSARIFGTPGGTTEYVSQRDDNSSVSLTAFGTAWAGSAAYTFTRWSLNGVDQPIGEKSVAFNINADTAAIATYAAAAARRSVFVSTTGASGGAGTIGDPIDLRTALTTNTKVVAGDNVWIRGGTYASATGWLKSSGSVGMSDAPIIYRAWADEHPVLTSTSGAVLTITSVPYVRFQGLDVNCAPTTGDGISVGVGNTGLKLINNAIHDSTQLYGTAMAPIKYAEGVAGEGHELYGNLCYRTGGRGMAPVLNLTTNPGVLTIADNVVFLNKNDGIQCDLVSGSTAPLGNLLLDGNIVYLNGQLLAGCKAINLRSGTAVRMDNITLRNCVVYVPDATGQGLAIKLGRNNQSVANGTVTLSNNAIFGGDAEGGVSANSWLQIVSSGNLMFNGKGPVFNVFSIPTTGWDKTQSTVNNNSYYGTATFVLNYAPNGGTASLATWQGWTGWDGASTLAATIPPTPIIRLRPNSYEETKAYLAVYNRGGASPVSIDLAALWGIAAGQGYKIISVEDIWGAPAAEGVYSGPISLTPQGSDTGQIFTAYLVKKTLTLDVQSTPITSVVITGAPAGTTNYSSELYADSQVSLSAPLISADENYGFRRWELNGIAQPNEQRVIAFAIQADTMAVAIYELKNPTIFPTNPTTCPEIVTNCPVTPTLCPPGETGCPAVETACPPVSTSCPSSETACPPVATSCPPSNTSCPPADTACPPIGTACPVQPTACPPVGTACPPEPTACPPSGTSCPLVETACPPVQTSCPAVATECPEETTACPLAPTVCPLGETYCPPATTSCPATTTACPEAATSCPPSATQCPPATTSCPPVATSCPPAATSCPPVSTSCPIVTTSCPPASTSCPTVNTQCPSLTTSCPATTTVCPEAATNCSSVSTSCPPVDTNCPPMTTSCPPATTVCPEAATQCPPATTSCPLVPTVCPPGATNCPPVETQCPPSATSCPAIDTQCPPVTTSCPATTTVCPETATICPLISTSCPTSDTQCPPMTTSCPPMATVCPEAATNCPPVSTSCPAVATQCPFVNANVFVQSTPVTGVTITGTLAGASNYSALVTMCPSTAVSLTAPATVLNGGGRYVFVRWSVNGVPQLYGQATAAFSVTGETTAVAAYALMADVFVSSSGTPGGAGTINDPIDLRTALTTSTKVVAGSNVWIRGGTYASATGWSKSSGSVGTSELPIIYRAYANEHPVLTSSSGAVLTIANAPYVRFQGLDVNCAATTGDGVLINSGNTGLKLINNAIHDNTGAVTASIKYGDSVAGEGHELYGNLCYRTGGRGMAPVLNLTTNPGLMAVTDNVIFLNKNDGIQYDLGSAPLGNILLDGNIVCLNGQITASCKGIHLRSGSLVSMDNITLRNCVVYIPDGSGYGPAIRLGRSPQTVANGTITLSNNLVFGGDTEGGISLNCWSRIVSSGNLLFNGKGPAFNVNSIPTGWDKTQSTVNNNSYYGTNTSILRYGSNGGTVSLATWQGWTGWDGASTLAATIPPAPIVRLRPNFYEPTKAYLAVYNRGGASPVSIDLGALWGMRNGQGYRITSVENIWGAPAAEGVYSGPVSLTPQGTDPNFTTYLVEKALTLEVESSPFAGVTIAGAPAGTTNYSSEVYANSSVSLTAPQVVNIGPTERSFVRWTINGVQQPDDQTAVSFNICDATTAVTTYSNHVVCHISLKSGGWNLVSLPIVPDDPDPNSVFGAKLLQCYAWTAGSGPYFAPTTIESKRGYWVAVNEDCEIDVAGPLAASTSIHLVNNWNLVGPRNDSPIPTDEGIMAVFAWEWPEGLSRYVVPTQCLSGRGYWIAASKVMDIWSDGAVQHALNVQSDPITGVAIAGSSPGTTNYSAQVDDGTTVELTAPATAVNGGTDYNFVRWTRNGANQPDGQTALSFSINEATTCVAVYSVARRMLTVESSAAGNVVITGAPAGTTNYSSNCDDNSSVSLTAPANVSQSGVDYVFHRWTIAGVPQPDGQVAVSFTINADTTVVAAYRCVFHLSLKSGGWNLISLPVIPDDPTPRSVFGASLLQCYAWNVGLGSYYSPTTIESIRGYWVAVSADSEVDVIGARPSGSSVQLSNNWNLVGPRDSSPIPTGPGVPAIYAWEWPAGLPRYIVPTECLPGHGYWIAATQEIIIW